MIKWISENGASENGDVFIFEHDDNPLDLGVAWGAEGWGGRDGNLHKPNWLVVWDIFYFPIYWE